MINTIILTASEFNKISQSLLNESSEFWSLSVYDLDTYIVTLRRELNRDESDLSKKAEFSNKDSFIEHVKNNKSSFVKNEDVLSKSEDYLFKKDLLSEEQKNKIRESRENRGYVGIEPEPEPEPENRR